PESAQLHARPFVHFLAVGFPFGRGGAETAAAPEPPAEDGAVRILHCPTDQATKGTQRVRAAVEGCRARGARIDYRELSGRPHAEVLAALDWTDLVIDQTFSDTPMAALVTEAAYFGKPSVVGSYAAGARLEVQGMATPPSLFCHPDALDEAIWTLVSDRAARLDLGRRAREFVRGEWAPASVAARMLRVISDEAPSSWTVRPEQLGYVFGYGIAEDVLRARLRRLIAERGDEVLGIPTGSPLLPAIRSLASD
ncbi:MAG: glycosyltransferase, partial [Candidatus Limnocylindria bacterium]